MLGWKISLIAIVTFLIFMDLFLYWKKSGHRKKALFVIKIRSLHKALLVFASLLGIIFLMSLGVEKQIDFPVTLLFITFFLHMLLIPSLSDIIVGVDGIYVMKLTPWYKIKNISKQHGFIYIEETARRKFSALQFHKLLWKFSPEDIKRIKNLIKKKKKR